MTPKRDNEIRRRAQRAYEFATAELARTDDQPINGDATNWEDRRAAEKAWRGTPEYARLIEYRGWLYDVEHAADYRRRHPVVRMVRRSRSIGRVERGQYGEPDSRFSWRWQNLDSDLRTLDECPSFMGLPLPDTRHQGRAWFDWYVRSADRKPFRIEAEWSFGKAVWSSGVSYSRRNSGTVMLHAALRPVASIYLTLKHLWPRKQEQESRTYSVSLVDGDVHYDLGKPGSDDEWHRGDPLNWMRGIIHPLDKLFGRAEHRKEAVGPKVNAIASFPEGDYPLLLQREVRTWKRARWPWPMVSLSVDIESVRPAESQGKGENSWDCGPDAIWGMSSPGHSYEDAVAAYVKATLRDRAKRGHIADEHRTVFTEATS